MCFKKKRVIQPLGPSPSQSYSQPITAHTKKGRLSTKVITSLCSRQAIMTSDKMTTPVLPTPALQCTSSGGLGLFGSLVLFVWRRTDWISSRYAVKNQWNRKYSGMTAYQINNPIFMFAPLGQKTADRQCWTPVNQSQPLPVTGQATASARTKGRRRTQRSSQATLHIPN
jgi:hypothetical protein